MVARLIDSARSGLRLGHGRTEIAVALVLVGGGGFSFYLAGSDLLGCGRIYAGREIYGWLALAGAQSALFLAAPLSPRAQAAYRWTQYGALALVALVVAQLALAYPAAFVCTGVLAAAYWVPVRIWHALAGNRTPAAAGSLIAETLVFLLAAAVIHSVLAFVVLYTPGARLDDTAFLAIAAVSVLVAGLLVRRDRAIPAFSIAALPPLGLLLLTLLRAKFPDLAYDSLFYKATLPILIADWRTAITGMLDHSLLGTDLFEILNSQARIADQAYPVALTSAFSFVALWVLAPLAARSVMPRTLAGAHAFAINACALLLVSLSEPLVAAGTAYHEPLLAALLAASLLPIAAGWLFLGAAVAGKFTAIFIVPLVALLRWGPLPLSRAGLRGLLDAGKARPVLLAACVALSAIAVGEQLYRNLAFTGRVLAVSEIGVRWTDPHSAVLAPERQVSIFDVTEHRGFKEKYLRTFVHVLTLDRWIVPEELGFHQMPTSRLIAVALVLTLLVLALPRLRRRRHLLLLFLAWTACTAAMLNFFSQGRHLMPLSFGAAFLVAYLVAELLRDAPPGEGAGLGRAFCMALALAAIGDQVVGNFINDGWDCRRDIEARVEPSNYDHPRSPLERRLESIARDYRAAHGGGSPPTIACEDTAGRMHYLGTHYIYAYSTLVLNQRLLAAQPRQAELLPRALLAVCYVNRSFFEKLVTPSERGRYTEVEGVGGIHIMVSKPLMSGAPPASLLGASGGWLFARPSVTDFVDEWEQGFLGDQAPAQTPNGKGAFAGDLDGARVGVLLSPYRLTFQDVRYVNGDHLSIEMAMPYANSDGMDVEVTLAGGDGVPHAHRYSLKPKPKSAAGPQWEVHDIPIAPQMAGRGSLTITASSPSGDASADWVFFRRLRFASE